MLEYYGAAKHLKPVLYSTPVKEGDDDKEKDVYRPSLYSGMRPYNYYPYGQQQHQPVVYANYVPSGSYFRY